MTSQSTMFKDDPEYLKIKSELDPLIIGFFSLGKFNRKYIQFKKCLDDWNQRFLKILPTIGTIDSLQRITIQPLFQKENEKDNERLKTVIGLFRYLGLVESLGGQFVDLSILLLVANGYDFHVEREHDVPRIIHATTLRDLRNASLGVKAKFLERCNLKETTSLIDKDLRNSIAHLNFKINEDGTVSARSQGEQKAAINIYQKINEFNLKFTRLLIIFNEIQDHVFPHDKVPTKSH